MAKCIVRRLALFIAGVLGTWPIQAQAPVFEAATIKPSTTLGDSFLRTNPARLSATNCAMRWLIFEAYGVSERQASGGLSWIETDRFNSEAEAEGVNSRDQLLQMLRSLRADRFKMALHCETKELPGYDPRSN